MLFLMLLLFFIMYLLCVNIPMDHFKRMVSLALGGIGTGLMLGYASGAL